MKHIFRVDLHFKRKSNECEMKVAYFVYDEKTKILNMVFDNIVLTYEYKVYSLSYFHFMYMVGNHVIDSIFKFAAGIEFNKELNKY